MISFLFWFFMFLLALDAVMTLLQWIAKHPSEKTRLTVFILFVAVPASILVSLAVGK